MRICGKVYRIKLKINNRLKLHLKIASTTKDLTNKVLPHGRIRIQIIVIVFLKK